MGGRRAGAEKGIGTVSLPGDINFDKVLKEILGDMETVTSGWLAGRPRDETALLNRITERLQRSRRKCDVGVNEPMEMTAEFFELHRRGDRQTDAHAADLAVTIDIPSQNFRKTALFQLKVSRDYVATLEKRQILDALTLNEIAERSFVLAVDEERSGYRVRSTWKCSTEFQEQENKKVTTDSWDFLVVWLLKWFSCEEGPLSKPDDPNPIERLLEHFTIPAESLSRRGFINENLPRDFLPAKAWLRYGFYPKKSEDQ